MDVKKKKFLKKVMIICVAIIVIEVVAMLIMTIKNERGIDRVQGLNDVVKVSDGYVGVGVSDFHQNSFVKEKKYQYTNIEKEKQNIVKRLII